MGFWDCQWCFLRCLLLVLTCKGYHHPWWARKFRWFNPVFAKMSVLSGMSMSVRLFQVSSHFQELANHIIANSLAYQRLSAKVKQSNGFRDNDRTEFLQNATEAHKARCPNVHNLEVWSNTNWSVLQIINKQDFYKSGLKMPCCYQSNYARLASLLIPDICHGRHRHIRVNFFWPV